jgi:hypothetical protein
MRSISKKEHSLWFLFVVIIIYCMCTYEVIKVQKSFNGICKLFCKKIVQMNFLAIAEKHKRLLFLASYQQIAQTLFFWDKIKGCFVKLLRLATSRCYANVFFNGKKIDSDTERNFCPEATAHTA